MFTLQVAVRVRNPALLLGRPAATKAAVLVAGECPDPDGIAEHVSTSDEAATSRQSDRANMSAHVL